MIPRPPYDWSPFQQSVDAAEVISVNGYVERIVGLLIEATGPRAPVGGICRIYPRQPDGREAAPIIAEIVGFDERSVQLMPLQHVYNVSPGSRVEKARRSPTVPVGDAFLGRIVNGLGQPMDGKPAPQGSKRLPIYGQPLNPVNRQRITKSLDLGVRSMNGILTVGQGQKIGIFAGSGVGKSVLLGMIARNTEADVNVIALIGERGREVREFLDRDLSLEGLKHSVVVCATSDRTALERLRAGYLATTMAEYFRSQGAKVLFMMDSLTRLAMARREIGLAIGEPPTNKGYTPSVFALLPSLLERIGNDERGGSLTGIYTVLVEADDINDPIGDAARSILDGHVFLSRELAARNHFPAIDILNSTSRVMGDIVSRQQMEWAAWIRELLAVYTEAEDLINIGAYQKGANPRIDYAITVIDAVRGFLRQGITDRVTMQDTLMGMAQIFRQNPPPWVKKTGKENQPPARG
ncbi:MAG: FliI/YscN family ATPase [Myxococcales bacterium]|nr:FliI/YscN family ATPase [Myxococcales bacterium]